MQYKCCLCGGKFEGWGNNPEPLRQSNLKCCDDCNMKFVIPARLLAIRKQEQWEKEQEKRK